MAKKNALKGSKQEKKNENKRVGGLLIPAGIFIGTGVGFITGNLPAGLFIGMGAGFVMFALVSRLECSKAE